jgi:type II secretory pathway component GspD/PulD (secretin)
MNPTRLIRLALAAVLAVMAVRAVGQNMLEIIPLRNRTVEQLLPALRPLVEPGGTLTGQGNQLIVRTSPANLDDLKRALEALDRPLRRLEVSVRFDEAFDAAARGVEASGRIGNRDSRVEVRAVDQRTTGAERVDQRIQVLEGGRAFIMAGQSRVLPPGVVWESATGFEARPRVSGETVLVDIAPRRETLNQQQSLGTTVSARLGEWFEVGGAVGSRVWLKVEEIRP